MCGLKVRFSQSPEHRSVFNYALKVEVLSSTGGIPTKIFVYHQSPAGIGGNTFATFDHVATPVDLQEIPEDAASDTVPWYRTDKVVVWFRNLSDVELAKQMFVDDISALQQTYNILTGENNFMRQTDVDFCGSGVHTGDCVEEEIQQIKSDLQGKVSKDALGGIEFFTNDAAGLRSAVKAIGNALGATIVKSIALAAGMFALCANGAGFSGERYAQLDLDENPIVVTNVTFDGLATVEDVLGLQDAVSSNELAIAELKESSEQAIEELRESKADIGRIGVPSYEKLPNVAGYRATGGYWVCDWNGEILSPSTNFLAGAAVWFIQGEGLAQTNLYCNLGVDFDLTKDANWSISAEDDSGGFVLIPVIYEGEEEAVYFSFETNCSAKVSRLFFQDPYFPEVQFSLHYISTVAYSDEVDDSIRSAVTFATNATLQAVEEKKYLTSEQDPTVHEWAKSAEKPEYTADEVNALPAQKKTDNDGTYYQVDVDRIVSGSETNRFEFPLVEFMNIMVPGGLDSISVNDKTIRSSLDDLTNNLASVSHTGSYDDLNDLPDTISGYGITDAYTKNEVDDMAGYVHECSTCGVHLDNYGYSSLNLFFRSRAFGMRNGDKLKSITLHTSSSTGNTSSTVYARLVKYDSASSVSAVAVSEGTSMYAVDSDVTFVFPDEPVLIGGDQYYRLELTTSKSLTPGNSTINAQLRIYFDNDGIQHTDCYFRNYQFVPLMSVRYVGIGSPMLLDADNSIYNGTTTFHTGSTLAIQGEFVVMTNGSVTIQSWDQIRLSSGQTLPEFIIMAVNAGLSTSLPE